MKDEKPQLRKRSLDTKLCIPVSDPVIAMLEDQFCGGRVVPLREIAHCAQVRKLTDEQKRRHAIIQFSFLFLNSLNEPLVIRRGPAHLITTGYSVLHSFSPVQMTAPRVPKGLTDIDEMLRENVTILKGSYALRVFALMRNLRKGIAFYFTAFAAQFNLQKPELLTHEEDAFEGPLPVSRPDSPRFRNIMRSMKEKAADAAALDI